LRSTLLAIDVEEDGVGDGEGSFSGISMRARFAGGSLVLGLKKSIMPRLRVVSDFGAMTTAAAEAASRVHNYDTETLRIL
jgi:hypothetical protein